MAISDYMKNVGANLGSRSDVARASSGGGIDLDSLTRWADAIEDKIKHGGGGCGGGGGLDNGLLMNAAGEVVLAGPVLFTITVNVQGRPLSRNKLQMQSTVPGGAFKVTDIKIGTNALNFGGLVPSFVLDPTNQSTTGMDLEAPDHILTGATTVTISGESYVAGGHRIFAALMSADRDAYAEAAGKCRVPSR